MAVVELKEHVKMQPMNFFIQVDPLPDAETASGLIVASGSEAQHGLVRVVTADKELKDGDDGPMYEQGDILLVHKRLIAPVMIGGRQAHIVQSEHVVAKILE